MRSRNDVDLSFVLDRRGRRSLQKLVHIEMCPYLPDKSKLEAQKNTRRNVGCFYLIEFNYSSLVSGAFSVSSTVSTVSTASSTISTASPSTGSTAGATSSSGSSFATLVKLTIC